MLLVRAGALGDVLLLRRTVAALHGAGHEVTLLAPREPGAALVGPGGSEVERLLAWERPEVAALFAGDPDPVQPSDESTGHALAVVYSRSESLARSLRARLPRLVVHDPSPPAAVPAARWLASALEGVGLDASAEPPVCAATAGEEDQARRLWQRLPPRFLAVHPGSGSPRKNWPAGRFLDLIREVQPPEPWLLVCGPADGAAVAALGRPSAALVAEALPVRVLGAVLSRAGVFVGNDSGVSHLAAAWGAPTVALFGPTDAAVWAPEGPRVRAIQSATGDMDGIHVEQVLAGVTAVCAQEP